MIVIIIIIFAWSCPLAGPNWGPASSRAAEGVYRNYVAGRVQWRLATFSLSLARRQQSKSTSALSRKGRTPTATNAALIFNEFQILLARRRREIDHSTLGERLEAKGWRRLGRFSLDVSPSASSLSDRVSSFIFAQSDNVLPFN